MVSDTVIVNGAALDNAANLQEDEFSTNEFVHSAGNLETMADQGLKVKRYTPRSPVAAMDSPRDSTGS